MPWWSWILIWVALGACALLTLVLGGIYLFRKGLTAMRAAGEALEQVADRRPAVPVPSAPAGPVPGSAVFADPEQMRREYDEGREQRRVARRDRRVARRRARGQMQSLTDLGLN
ncbi:hypothetical protein GCM10027449_31060 [Sinomonas notoginsengisoli]|uniref:hypothetical protein n=1 Tax=Sinomonas notoginsengisoli TaxID=1457311 RepID=UPI001F48ECC3|nr:hypothetical protein [Sinomonas notoginsengisoli]